MKKAMLVKFILTMAITALAGGCKPTMPVSVSFRDAKVGKGLVAQIHNNSDTTMKLLFEVSSPTSGETKKETFVVGAKETKEFGWAEGWPFVSGESIRIHDADYADLKLKVP